MSPRRKSGHPLPTVINPPRRCIQIFIPDERFHRGAFLYQIKQLATWFNWDEDELHTGAKVADVWKDVFLQVVGEFRKESSCEDCGEPPDCENCYEYPPSADFIEYNPTDPYGVKQSSTSELYPRGAWKVAASTIPLAWEEGDVFTEGTTAFAAIDPLNPLTYAEYLARLPIEGLPRFKVSVKNAREVELHFRLIPQGGWAIITQDGDPLTAQFVNFQSFSIGNFTDWTEILTVVDDFFNAFTTGEVKNNHIIELSWAEKGDHYVEVTFLPIPQLPDFWNSGFGAALHKVVVCGDPQPLPEPEVVDTGDGIEIIDPITKEVIKFVPFSEIPSAMGNGDCHSDCDDCDCDDCDE